MPFFLTKRASGTTNTTDYTGTLVLEDGTRSRMLFDGGYISMSDNAYHFFITDHLGSVRVVASASGVAEEYNHYYPLGGLLPTSTSATGIQPVKYQGKEWAGSKGLNLYDFGARRYDPATGRWLSPDPLAEKYYGHSPYLFCAANPMRYVDPEGNEPIKSYAGTIGGFIRFMNDLPTGIGLSTGEDAHKAMLRMGRIRGIKPANTAPFNTSGHNRYIYTEKGGWIDMAHFMFYAGRAYNYKLLKHRAQEMISSEGFAQLPPDAQVRWIKQASMDPVGETIQEGYLQELTDLLTAPHSAYSYEDLPSDRFGADFGVFFFDPNSKKSFSEQIKNYFDTVLRGLSPHNAPNYKELPEDYPDKPTRKNTTTNPLR